MSKGMLFLFAVLFFSGARAFAGVAAPADTAPPVRVPSGKSGTSDSAGIGDTSTSAASGPGATLEIRTSTAGVRVYADSVSLGITPFAPVTLVEGVHILRYVPPDADRWLSRAVVETVTIRRRELLVRSPEFPAIYHITTEPYGATVLVNGLAAGTTPLDLRPGSVREPVTVTKDGYDDVSVSLAGAERQVHLLLHPRSGSPADPQSLYLSREQTKGSFPIVLTAGATVLTGAAAAYFKIKADNSYDDYRRNGTEASLSQVRALDVASGISLAASELGLFTLSYFLLSR